MSHLALRHPLTLLACVVLAGCVVPLVEPEQARLAYLRAHGELEWEVAQAIRQGKVIRGMSREQVEACWGSPAVIDTSEAIGLHLEWGEEVWEYRSDSVFTVHPEATVIFRNGKVADVSPAYLSEIED